MPIGTAPLSFRLPSMSEILAVSRSRGRNSEAPHLWKGLLGAWPMQEGGGDKVYDVSGYGRPLAMAQADQSTKWSTDSIGHVLRFDGADDSLIGTIATGTTHSWFSWHLNDGNSGSVRDFLISGTNSFIFASQRNNNISAYDRVNWHEFGGPTRDDVPHLFGLVLDADTLTTTCYLDGATLGTDGYAPLSVSSFRYMSESDGNNNWASGWLSSSLVYGRVLLPAEAQELYEDPWSMYRLRPVQVMGGVADVEDITATNAYGSDAISFTWTVNPAVRSSVGTGPISAPQVVGSDWAAVNQWDVVESAEGVEVFEEKGFRILEAGSYEVTALIRRDNQAGEIELAWATIDEDIGSLTIHETWPDTQVLQQATAELEPDTLVGVVVRTDATVPVMLNLLPGSSLSIKRVL